jgi:hypothetical protein
MKKRRRPTSLGMTGGVGRVRAARAAQDCAVSSSFGFREGRDRSNQLANVSALTRRSDNK